MLKINLLTERRDAERWYRRWKAGDLAIDFLAVDQDLTVRRRFNQERRNRKKRIASTVERRLGRHQRYLKKLKKAVAPAPAGEAIERGVNGCGEGRCPKGKDLGVNTPLPEFAFPSGELLSRDVVHAPRLRSSFQKRIRRK